MSRDLSLALLVTLVATVLLGSLISYLRTKTSLFHALLVAPLFVGAFVWMITELLSASIGIQRNGFWIVVVVLLSLVAISWKKITNGLKLIRNDFSHARETGTREIYALGAVKWWLLLSLLSALMIFVTTLFLALWGPPNNADSLGYHLPRVMHWLQNESVDHYATSDLRQLVIPSLSGYFLMWLYALSGSDYLLNGVQWTASLWGTLILALLVKRMTGSWVAGVIALILGASIPIGIAEASTTQSDWVTALWVIVLLGLFISRQFGSLKMSRYVSLVVVAVALGAATKATGVVSMAVIVCGSMVGEFFFKRYSVRTRISHSILVGISASAGLFIGLLPQALRNLRTFGNVFGDTYGLVVERVDAVTLIGNSLRIAINNIGIPTVLADYVNPHLNTFFHLLSIPWVDEAAVGYGHLPSISLARNEDYATNPIQLIGGIGAAIIVLVLIKAPRQIRVMSALALGTFFMSALIWKWNQWTNRFLIQVILMLIIPMSYLLWKGITNKKKRLNMARLLSICVIVCAALYGVFVSMTIQYRPILDPYGVFVYTREDRYFTVRGSDQRAAIDELGAQLEALPSGTVVGLELRGLDEYPVWALANPEGRLIFVHINVSNPSHAYEVKDFDVSYCLGNCNSDTD